MKEILRVKRIAMLMGVRMRGEQKIVGTSAGGEEAK
jgi:hypothetical protein